MKTREQLYGKEAACLLRDITTYHCIRYGQLQKLYCHKENQTLDNLLSYLRKQGRIFFDPATGIYYDNPDFQQDKEILKALWVLADFADKIEYHSSDEFPAKVIFFVDGEIYEIICVPLGKENLIEHASSQSLEEAEKRIVIVESLEQISQIHIRNAIAYCTVEDTGEIQYYMQKEESY